MNEEELLVSNEDVCVWERRKDDKGDFYHTCGGVTSNVEEYEWSKDFHFCPFCRRHLIHENNPST